MTFKLFLIKKGSSALSASAATVAVLSNGSEIASTDWPPLKRQRLRRIGCDLVTPLTKWAVVALNWMSVPFSDK